MTEPTVALDRITPDHDPDALPIPVYGGPEMARAFTAYRELQAALDAAMPDQIMRVGEKAFRKKAYWRAVAVAFNLVVEPIEERREVDGLFADGRENFGFLVTYRAATRSGRGVAGDGAVFAVDKAEKFKCPHPHPEWKGKTLHWPHEACPDFDPEFRWRTLPAQATVHNVRSHAHSRAYNRAVSNLVGFGEVSAEEVERDDDDRDEPRPAGRTASPAASTSAGRAPVKISEPQRKRLWAIAKGAGWEEAEIKTHLARHGFEHTADVTIDKYDAICKEFEGGVDGTRRS